MTVFPKREDVLRRQTPPLGRGRGREPAGSGDARRQDAAAAGAAGLEHRGPALPDPGAGAGRAGPRGCCPPPAAGVALCPRPPPTHGAPALTGPREPARAGRPSGRRRHCLGWGLPRAQTEPLGSGTPGRSLRPA